MTGSPSDNFHNQMSLVQGTAAAQSTMVHVAPVQTTATVARGLPERIRKLIDLQGSAAALAERCGFSAGAVRSWRDGHSDISRERCVTMARALGVSLPWLVAGEGPMAAAADDVIHQPAPLDRTAHSLARAASSRAGSLDSRLLAAALRLLQSYIGLVGGSLDPTARAELLTELYDILARAEDAEHIDRLITFHNALSDQLRRQRALIS
ncbi:helix-turn-helix domain-containing protein [Rhodanobacter glycinis]|nr:YdaS family helix-turn-helix protein [Rhodanobacter glycinis]